MNDPLARLPRRAAGSRGRRPLWLGGLLVLLCWSLSLLSTPGIALARSTAGGGHAPLSASAVHALQQALKKQIHVKHTGKALKPATTKAGVPLRPLTGGLPAYNNIGISDVTTRSTANFDTGARSYAAQALQDVGLAPGMTVTSQNITYIWPSVDPGVADNWQANGQVIPVTATTGAATVGFLGASTNGNASGTATLTYTDGTTSTFTLTLTDWWSSTPAAGNQQAAHMTTINTKHGTKSGNFYVYSATTALDPTKILQSVTLPSSVSPGQLHIFAVGVGGPAFNNTGISDDSNTGSANYDGGSSHYSYSAQALASKDLIPGQQFDFDGIAYPWPTAASGAVDNYQASGQILPIIPVPNATTLGFLGSTTNGGSTGASGTATMTFTDGITSTFTLALTNWWTGTPSFGNSIAATMSYLNQSSGQRTTTVYLFAAEFPIPAGKTLQSVTLPSSVTNGQLHVFALGTRTDRNNLGTSNDSQHAEGNYDGNYSTWSIQALEAAHFQQGQAFSFNGVQFTWPASYGTQADNYQAVGQTIPFTSDVSDTTLAFVGSATNAPSGSSGTATLIYMDGTTSTFTLGFTDWWTGTPQFNNLLVASFTTINNLSGSRPGSYYLYYAETALLAGKQLQSVILPATVSQGQMHIFAIGTRSAYNNTGISDDSTPAGANFDGSGNSYSEEDFTNPDVAGWNPGDTLTYEGINYIWPGVPAGKGDNYAAQGQTIPVTPVAGATSIGFVGAATGDGSAGTSSGTVTLTYTDGSTSTFTLGFTDWMLTATPLTGNRLFAALPHENTPTGQLSQYVSLFEMETPLTAGKTLQSVTLPSSVNQGQLHVFMMGTRAGENYPNNIGTSDDSDTLFASLDGNGASYSIEALEGAGLYEGQPFTFNGVTFTWPASYSVIPDNYQVAGQTLPAAQITGPLTDAGTLAFLGAATNTGSGGGTSSAGTATITYTDGSTQTFTLTLTDWWNDTPQAGNQQAATCSYINISTGQLSQTVYVYYTDVALQAGKTIQSVTFPTTVSKGQLHIFALGTK